MTFFILLSFAGQLFEPILRKAEKKGGKGNIIGMSKTSLDYFETNTRIFID